MDEQEWRDLGFNFKCNGITFYKLSGETDFDVDEVAYEFQGSDDPMAALIKFALDNGVENV